MCHRIDPLGVIPFLPGPLASMLARSVAICRGASIPFHIAHPVDCSMCTTAHLERAGSLVCAPPSSPRGSQPVKACVLRAAPSLMIGRDGRHDMSRASIPRTRARRVGRTEEAGRRDRLALRPGLTCGAGEVEMRSAIAPSSRGTVGLIFFALIRLHLAL